MSGLKHLGFPTEPQLERHDDCDSILSVEKWQFVTITHHLPPQDPVEDQIADDHPIEDQPSHIVPTEEP